MTTRTKTVRVVRGQTGETGTDEQVGAKGEQLSCSLDTRVKDLPVGLSKVPLRESARRYICRRGSVSGLWRRRVRGEVLDMTISRVPRAWSPETKSGGQKGFRNFPRRVDPGTWYPHFFFLQN